jgi:hypothetical protein
MGRQMDDSFTISMAGIERWLFKPSSGFWSGEIRERARAIAETTLEPWNDGHEFSEFQR